jgi:hypothetical protein
MEQQDMMRTLREMVEGNTRVNRWSVGEMAHSPAGFAHLDDNLAPQRESVIQPPGRAAQESMRPWPHLDQAECRAYLRPLPRLARLIRNDWTKRSKA